MFNGQTLLFYNFEQQLIHQYTFVIEKDMDNYKQKILNILNYRFECANFLYYVKITIDCMIIFRPTRMINNCIDI